ncbi:hypothetical protein DQ04_13061020 [Trypanosoma grayi]|uniref:hypothetical protein n=1 Tax=Trypanosoma grayi TaxID=71804 RepID=UPI0004F445A5|nr:hypothetical protein DQ04_13061020 [Trypanosoma grayi]KEG06612.1 hypothetical protein DQ04_13061020 [Trypanosoma grayi]
MYACSRTRRQSPISRSSVSTPLQNSSISSRVALRRSSCGCNSSRLGVLAPAPATTTRGAAVGGELASLSRRSRSAVISLSAALVRAKSPSALPKALRTTSRGTPGNMVHNFFTRNSSAGLMRPFQKLP